MWQGVLNNHLGITCNDHGQDGRKITSVEMAIFQHQSVHHAPLGPFMGHSLPWAIKM